MGFSRQEYWGGFRFPSPGGLPDPGTEATPLMSSAVVSGFLTTSAPWEALMDIAQLIFKAHNPSLNNSFWEKKLGETFHSRQPWRFDLSTEGLELK